MGKIRRARLRRGEGRGETPEEHQHRIMDKGEELAKERQKIRECWITEVKGTESFKA